MNLSALKKIKNNNSGFTLIELLVVIGILGILAAALIATIDPFEQLKKAQDADVKNAAVEFVNANIRYYTTHASMPWNDTSNTAYQSACTSALGGATPSSATLNNLAASCLGALINDGELKRSFTNATGVMTGILISGTTNSVTACFQPQSRSQRNDPNTKYAADGSTSVTNCPNATSATCYYCAQ